MKENQASNVAMRIAAQREGTGWFIMRWVVPRALYSQLRLCVNHGVIVRPQPTFHIPPTWPFRYIGLQ